jgi:solute carrier family 35 protein C2
MVFDGWFTIFANETFFGSFSITMHTLLAVLFPGLIAFMMNVTEFGYVSTGSPRFSDPRLTDPRLSNTLPD